MKRIEFIAPVEAMRGNLSGKQTLEYPLNSNPAFEAPAGKHYATNYQPRFIGAKRASNNLKYFAVRTKSAINKTTKSILSMSLMGATGAIVGAILADKSSAVYQRAMFVYETYEATQSKKVSFREFLSRDIMTGLKNKKAVISIGLFPVPDMFININNPYVSGGRAPYSVTISDEVLVKFWPVLANDPVLFTVDGQSGIAHSGDKFSDVIASDYNVLDLESKTEGAYNAVVIGELYVNIAEGAEYTASTGTDVDVAAKYKLSETFIDPS